RRVATALRLSGLPKGMNLDNFDFLFQPSVDRAKIDMLSTCEFIKRKENILFFGPPGVGNYVKLCIRERATSHRQSAMRPV
ncbi:MAG: ATP-binding protein, partial [Spirochaetota bacterium]|nr:ATP-binding protein [Spirochaetota bacterium]